MTDLETISITCPTRGRAAKLPLFHELAVATCDQPENLEIVYACDDDDMESVEVVSGLRGCKVTLLTQERKYGVPKWQDCGMAASGDILMFCGDDIHFRTKGWDNRVREAFEAWGDRLGLVCINDAYWEGSLATNIFIHRKWRDALGWFAPKGLIHNFIDCWLDDIAKMLPEGRRVYLGDVMAEHMHFTRGKSENDDTYKIQEPWKAADKAFFASHRAKRLESVDVLFDAINAYEAEAE